MVFKGVWVYTCTTRKVQSIHLRKADLYYMYDTTNQTLGCVLYNTLGVFSYTLARVLLEYMWFVPAVFL